MGKHGVSAGRTAVLRGRGDERCQNDRAKKAERQAARLP